MGEVLGVDVSHHNGKIDWGAVAKNGKKFAIMKAQYEAQSHRKDETFEYNYAEAGKNGLARGVYIYIAGHSIADPVSDAQSLLKHLHGRVLEYGIWLDLEDKTLRAIGRNRIQELAYLYTNIFRSAGYYVGIYCNYDWYKNVMTDKLKADFDFWIARYPKNDAGIYNNTSSLKPASIGVAWQYSSKGNVPGIKTRCDLNVDFDGVVNLMGASSSRKSNREIAEEVRQNKWGTKTSKPSRKELLTAAGYDYDTIQAIVNQLERTKG